MTGQLVLVVNEVGLGFVPGSPVVRRFRDHTGRLRRRLVAVADEVVFCLMGVPLRLEQSLEAQR